MPGSPITKTNRKSIWPDLWRKKTLLMGVINITPDSFSDGGNFFEVNDAKNRAQLLVDNGASLLDIGAQSTRPGALQVGAEEELKRLLPSLRIIRESYKEAFISIDTYLSEVALKSLELGADWINDISGGRLDPRILNVVADAGVPYVLTHSRGNSLNMDNLIDYQNLINDIYQELLFQTDIAIKSGIKSDRIIWDLGLGFAKSVDQNIIILKKLEFFNKEGFPLLLGPSRKRFIGHITGDKNPKDRVFGTMAVLCRCVQAKIDLVRVHDIEAANKTILMANKLWN